ncbi:NTF2 fold immunity protein [Verrucomicrobium sp. BvORR034]|uniref:NTF2 fold immunity protein n=1 Tax=Verrucomicrobium sp. BvORR034 TaxID=1396418 RepID=UPI000678CA5A|nr:NTF2 fold immunity protein [Verrucomicrobium sp. BvORR034]
MKTQLLLCAAALASAVAIAADAPKHNAKPKEGLVADAKTATAIAVAVWEPIYGAEKIARQKPYRAVLANGIWTVEGTFHGKGVGGVAVAEITQSDGRVVRVSHGK